MDSIGETLREARHQKEVSLEDVARQTKVKMDILEKLEAGEFDQLVSPTYAKGFLKMYAEYLGLDSASLVEAYVKSQGGLRRQGLQVETVAATRKRRPGELKLPVRELIAVVGGLTVAVLVVVVIVSVWGRRRAPSPKPAPPAKTTSVLPKLEYEAYYTPQNLPTPAPPAK